MAHAESRSTRNQPPGTVYLVGGAVRDELLGRPVRERDWVVVGATPAAMLERGFKQVGRDFPVFLHPLTGEEYALARTERKSGPGHTGFVCHAGVDVTLEQDLERRDLTINALARTADGTLVDPWGGRRDLDARWLRHVSAAFVEDPLRVFRVARFAAQLAPFGFRVAVETAALMREMTVRGELAELPAERVWQELVKALAAPAPARFFEVLERCGALAVWFPEVAGSVVGLELLLAPFDDALDRFGALGWLLGEDAVAALCERLKVPRDHRRLSTSVARYGPILAQRRGRTPDELLDAIKATGGLRQPAWFARVVAVVGRCAGLVLDDLVPLAAALRAVSAERHRARGLTGEALGDALRSEMLQLIAARA